MKIVACSTPNFIQTRNTFYGTRYLSHCCALAYYAAKRSFCNIEKLCWSTRVQMLPHFVSSHVIGHVPIRSAVGDFL